MPFFVSFFFVSCLLSCHSKPGTSVRAQSEQLPTAEEYLPVPQADSLLPGAYDLPSYLPLLEGKKVGLVVNQTSRIADQHLLDTLLGLGVAVSRIFAPEHGFRGTADAGKLLNDQIDSKTGIPIISLYGKHKKPTAKQLAALDVVVFDIQDVGVRFYTYISTMHYVMEACAAQKLPFLVLDRPNPNGFYVDGPVLDTAFRSFVGMHPIPIVHGLTVGELAKMICGEGWLQTEVPLDLTVVKCLNYRHSDRYVLPVKPSPNLPNARAVAYYPSLCLFEATIVSVGRGTSTPFQQIGSPWHQKFYEYSFTPKKMPGASSPKHQNKKCYGKAFRHETLPQEFSLTELIRFYQQSPRKKNFFTHKKFFDQLSGTDRLRKQIEAGKSAAEIRQGWQKKLTEFREMRKKYLLYPN